MFPKCLWIARYMPYPMDAGAKVYSAMLAQALADAGASVRFLGHSAAHASAPECAVDYRAVAGGTRNRHFALLSKLPLAAAIDATREYALLLDVQLKEQWDAIVFDGYGAGWALERCLDCARSAQQRRPVLVHISHNHEEQLWNSMAREARGSIPRRLALRQNALKVRTLERRLVRSVDLLSVIADEDAQTLGSALPKRRVLTLTPGFAGAAVRSRFIDAMTPRRAIVVGSFRWVMKQENLARLLEQADAVFERHGIGLDIVGDIPDELLRTLRARCRITHFHGFVHDLAPLLSRARLAIVPEAIGGGFKLKFLDYIFARVPVATLSHAVAGLPDAVRDAMLARPDLSTLIEAIVTHIDRLDELNRMQQQAFAAAATLFRWEDRGLQLKQAIVRVQMERREARLPIAASPHAPTTAT